MLIMFMTNCGFSVAVHQESISLSWNWALMIILIWKISSLGQTVIPSIHLIGEGAKRHFTYRAVQKISKIITKPLRKNSAQNKEFIAATGARRFARVSNKDDHTNCPQAQYRRMHVENIKNTNNIPSRTYADVVGNRHYNYSIPTNNFYSPLNY